MQFTDDEIETIKLVLEDWCCTDYSDADYDKVRAIGIKLGVWEEEKPPTEEELKRREEFRNSPYGLFISKIFNQSNEYFDKMAQDLMRDNAFTSGEHWPVETVLKVKLPNDWNK